MILSTLLNTNDDGHLVDFGQAVTEISHGGYIPERRQYPPFRKVFYEDPRYNPPLENAHQSYNFEAHFKEQSTHWKRPGVGFTLPTQPRFATFSSSPTIPDEFPFVSHKGQKYWGRERRINPFCKAKLYTRPIDRVVIKRETESIPIGPGSYNMPDLWAESRSSFCGINKPSYFMESVTKRDLYDVMKIGNTDSSKDSEKTKKRSIPLSKIRPLIASTGPDPIPLHSSDTTATLAPLQSPTPRSPDDKNNHPSNSTSNLLITDEFNNNNLHPSTHQPLNRSATAPPPIQSQKGLEGVNTQHGTQKSFFDSTAPCYTFSRCQTPLGGYSTNGGGGGGSRADVQFHRVLTPDGSAVIVPVGPMDDVLRVVPSGSILSENWGTTFKQAEKDDVLRIITPYKMSFSTNTSIQELNLNIPLSSTKGNGNGNNTATNSPPSSPPPYHQLTLVSGRRRSPQSISSSSKPIKLLPGSSASSPLLKLKAGEWKPPTSPGKSPMRKASEKREVAKLLGTSASKLLSEFSAGGVPIGVADTVAIDPTTTVPATATFNSYQPSKSRKGGGALNHTPQRGGGDVLGNNLKPIPDDILLEASIRSSLLLTQLPEY